jgi:hypothetical protein
MYNHLTIAEAHKRYGGMGTLLVNKVREQHSTDFHISLLISDSQSSYSLLMRNVIPKIFLRYLQSQLTNLAS